MADIEFSYENIADGRKGVTAAGTAERLIAASTAIRKVIINAFPENTDVVVVGASTVVAALATRRGISLSPGESVTLRVSDLYNVYADAVVSGEGVSYVYFW